MKIGLICEKGGRAYNQDYADYAVSGDYICVAVADGLGAYDGSEAASVAAVKCIIKLFRKAVKKGEELFSGVTINKFFKSAHSAIHKLKSESPELSLGCTTLSVVIANGRDLLCSHVGDSRIYFFKNDCIEFYSKDHSLARVAAERGEITFAQIRNHKDQNKLTRVLGGDYFVQPDFKIYHGYTQSDSVLVCTDGFWEHVYEEDMENALRSTPSAHLALSQMRQVHDKNAPLSCDNFSAVLLRLGEVITQKSGSMTATVTLIDGDENEEKSIVCNKNDDTVDKITDNDHEN